MSYDPDEVSTGEMLEAIKETGFRPSLAGSRIALSVVAKVTGAFPPLIQAALDEAASEGKTVFIYFFAEWCGACRTMDQTTFADAAVKNALEAGYVFVKVDTDKHPDVGKYFGIVGLPTVMALGQTGDVLYRHAGPLEAESLVKVLHEMTAQRITAGTPR